MMVGKQHIRWFIVFLLLMGALFGLRWLKHKTDFASPIVSDSMYPTLKVYDRIWTNPWETPELGDILSFNCFSKEKCGNDTWRALYNESPISHRWVSTDKDGCMHIIGDNKNVNWDPNFCLYPWEIRINGVVHKL